MLRLLLLLMIAVVTIFAKSCIDCICQRESGCRKLGCADDGGSLSCGYFQIKKPYYIDCGQPGKKAGESIDTAWKRCASDKGCSKLCVEKYVKRYKRNCSNKSQCETMARLHNGGPNGCKTTATIGYWNAIQKCIG
ncbi:unnamed protein product, partial [Mesorhabditis belari]|uniref:lysozyme n=1 Tax=Mesorhabditis belari TaxID=2138241 RepID=A0AAF3FRF6_9BILA